MIISYSKLILFFTNSGVADGVGGWREYGIDPSLFSSSLMEACRSLIDNKLIDLNPLTLKELLSRGYKQLLEDKQCIIGKIQTYFVFFFIFIYFLFR